MQLPLIDITSFLRNGSSDEKMRTAILLHDACRKYGAFYLQGAGLDDIRLIQDMKSFFSLPASEKQRIAIHEGGFTRGYIGMGEESGSDALEVKEAFSYGYPWQQGRIPENGMQGENVWPAQELLPGGWQKRMEEFYGKMIAISEGLTRAFSLSYGKPENHLAGFCNGGETVSVMRLFHYFPYHRADQRFPDTRERIGSSAHTDWGFLTLILQEEGVTGLQLFHEDQWFDVPPVPGTLLVNCGDYFSLLTGGEYLSPLHRVVSDGRERTSAVLFYYPDYAARIPLLFNREYSLFKDQQRFGEKIDAAALSDKPFGKYIQEKWEQVQRKNA